MLFVQEFLEFMLFSMIESFAIVAIMLAVFRFKLSNYLWPALLVTFVMSLQSFGLRTELELSQIAPIVNLVLLTFFAMMFLHVPMVWAAIMSAIGSVFTILMQVIIVAVSGQSVEFFQAVPARGYLLQSMTGLIVVALSLFLYRFGIGLSFQFERLRFRLERAMIYSLLAIIVIAFGILATQRAVYFDILFFLLALLFFVYYTIRKEAGHD